MKKVKIDFSRLNNYRLDTFAKSVYKSLKGNAHFEKLSDDAESLNTVSFEFSEALINLRNGAPNAKAILKQKREALIKTLRVLGIKVNLEADGDEAKLLTTAYPLAKDRAAAGELGNAGPATITPGIGHGSLKIRMGKVKNAHSYLFQITKAPATKDSVWISFPCSKSTYAFTGLESGQQYVLRAGALGIDSNMVFSEEISSYVL